MRLKLIACEILYREFCAAIARSPHQVDATFLTKGLHDIGQTGMQARLREAIDAVDPAAGYDAVLLGYALCSNGIVGLRAGKLPLVVARAHDCITLFLGDRRRYLDYFTDHPGYYYKTIGWIERGSELVPLAGQTVSGGLSTPNYEELVAKYGEDNARFLFQQLGDLTRHYGGLAYIAMGVGPDDRYEEETRALAERRGWKFDRLEGDMSLIQGLVDGAWDASRYLVVPPGAEVRVTYDERIIEAQGDEAA